MPDNKTNEGALLDVLTVQERQVLKSIVAGLSQKAIAACLGLGEAEATAVRQSLMHKLGASCTADAVRVGIQAGL